MSRFYDNEEFMEAARDGQVHLVSKFYPSDLFGRFLSGWGDPIISCLDARIRIAGRFYAPAREKAICIPMNDDMSVV